MMFGLRVLSFLFVFLTSAGCFAADATLTDALNAITDTAAKICNTVPTSGERDSAEVKGDVKAEVSGLLKKLGDLGISGTGRYTHDDYVGVVQEQLAAALKNNSDCRLTVFMALQGKLMPQSGAPAAPSGWSMSPEQAESCGFGWPRFPQSLPYSSSAGRWRRTASAWHIFSSMCCSGPHGRFHSQ